MREILFGFGIGLATGGFLALYIRCEALYRSGFEAMRKLTMENLDEIADLHEAELKDLHVKYQKQLTDKLAFAHQEYMDRLYGFALLLEQASSQCSPELQHAVGVLKQKVEDMGAAKK